MPYDNHSKGIGHHLLAATLLVGLALPSPFAAASETTVEIEDIPTRLVLPSDPIEYPDPVCLGCKLVAKRTMTAASPDASRGHLFVTYEDHERPVFVGDLVLTVFLSGAEECRTVTLDGVELTHGQTAALLIDPGPDWGWDEVEAVWVEPRPAS